jgi:hypothetical protein
MHINSILISVLLVVSISNINKYIHGSINSIFNKNNNLRISIFLKYSNNLTSLENN